jgi:hypothetical protein
MLSADDNPRHLYFPFWVNSMFSKSQSQEVRIHLKVKVTPFSKARSTGWTTMSFYSFISAQTFVLVISAGLPPHSSPLNQSIWPVLTHTDNIYNLGYQ